MSHLLIVEITSILLFVWGFCQVRSNGAGRSLEYVMIFFYGIILEELDMRIFKTYHYSSEFLLMAWKAPLSIAFLWAVILAGSMTISDRIGLPALARPFLDALLAVWIDLALDAVAIRLKYWTWIIPLDAGWFGVPPANLYAWMWVAFSYSMLARIVRFLIQKNERWKWAYIPLPILAYSGLFFTMSSFGGIANALGLKTQNERLIIFWVLFLIFLFAVLIFWKCRKGRSESLPSVWPQSRLLIHAYFLAAFFIGGMYRKLPLLGMIAAAVLALEVLFLRTFCLKPTQHRPS
ncbi:MAG: carotenoid biosynthesis protein [Candidatus Omnitrophica bacterium]|nr:carotenoid biosynthesis protein [Candidatus Omnitrophota bacterium]